MSIRFYEVGALVFIAALVWPFQALANEAEAAKLGTELTPVGANPNPGPEGIIPAFSGKWLGAPPQVNYDGSYCPNPYPDEAPLFTITGDNWTQYAKYLSPGQEALFQAHPATFEMHIYPTHRDFRRTDRRLENIRLNALHARIVNQGLTLKGAYGGVAFPVPETGLEVIYNILTSSPAWFIESPRMSAYVYPNGSISWSRSFLRVYNPYARGNDRAGWDYDDVYSYSISEEKLPPRNAGRITFTANTFDFRGVSRQTWQYKPGLRRLRKTPDVGFDYPSDTGPRVVDEQKGFNGSPELYHWKLVGKHRMYVPFHTYELDSPKLAYRDLLTGNGHATPDHIRYELRRVWVVEGTLKPNRRHVYEKRRMYVEEDSWYVVMADNYDNRGKLWRVALYGTYYDYAANGYYANVSMYHDLRSGAYSIEGMTNEMPHAAQLNRREPRPGEFSPAGVLRTAQ